MADIYFYVEGYYERKDGRRTAWRRVRLNEVDEKIRNPAQNYNCFATIQRFKNAIGEEGEPHLCDLYFDLDGTIENAQVDARKVVDYFRSMGVPKEGIRVFFSGKKGFHILVNHRLLGVQPHPELTYIYKRAAHYVANVLQLTTFDHTVYSKKRQLRLPGSMHKDTGKFKTELDHMQLRTLTPDKIKELATQPREPLWEESDLEDMAVNDTAAAWWANFRDTYEHEKNLEKLRPRQPIKNLGTDDHPVCVKWFREHDHIPVKGQGNKAALALASYYKDKGLNEADTLAILEPWATSLTNTSTAGNHRESIASVRSVAHSVFDNQSKYRFACAFIRAVGNAENPVPCLGDQCPHIDPGSQEPDDPIELHLSQASRAEFVGKKLKIKVTLQGKDQAPFIVPRKFEVECQAGEGGKYCAGCPTMSYGGKREFEFKVNDDGMIEMCKTTSLQRGALLRKRAKIPQTCKQHRLRVTDLVNVEEVRLIPQIDFSETNQQEYAVRVGFYIGHGIRANERYEVIGYTLPDPTSQYAVQAFEEAAPSQENIQTFNADKKMLEQLRIFQVPKGGTLDAKFAEIHSDIEANVTRIFRRSLLAISMDLIYHTALSFHFNGSYVHKGWGEMLVLGDSGQGKSTLIEQMRKHYQAGEILNGESASRTGLLYTLTESSKRWMLVWGRIPLNDMSLLVIDEASGLSHEDIAQMSGARASGIAEVNRVGVSAQTPSRTRLVFSSNPRPGKPLRQYQWAVLAVCDGSQRQLIEKAEDVRRFDFALAVKSGDVDPNIMNRSVFERVEHVYTSSLCNTLIRWVWSRRENQVEFTPKATTDILGWSSQFAKMYHSSIPLVEPADQRLKIARLSVAVAARVFSTDDQFDKIIVRPEHVEYTIGILMQCFATLGYDKYSEQMFEDSSMTVERKQKLDEEFKSLPRPYELSKTLLRFKERPFTKKALQDGMSYNRDQINEAIYFLTKHGLIEYTQYGYIKKEYFIEYLNELIAGRKKNPDAEPEQPPTPRQEFLRRPLYDDGD